MKKIFSFVLAFALLCSCVGIASAVGIQDKADSISIDEVQVVKATMQFLDVPGEAAVELLYDHNDQPSYLLGYTGDGYLIMDRESQVALEWGEGNPYQRHQSERKYYGAVLNYYVKEDAGEAYLNLSTEKIEPDVAHIEYTSRDLLRFNDGTGTIIPYGKYATVPYSTIPDTVTKTVKLKNAYTLIQRKAFGKNEDGTCSAIASSIALDYLDKVKNDNIVPESLELELLTNNKFDETQCPNAERFHQYIVQDCYMGSWTTPSKVVNGVETYAKKRGVEIYLNWANPDRFDIMDDIDNNIPGMITVDHRGLETEGGELIKKHTMLIYGYKTYAQFQVVGWLVHPGWWGTNYVEGSKDSPYYVKEQWINPAIGSCVLYQFSSPGWK